MAFFDSLSSITSFFALTDSADVPGGTKKAERDPYSKLMANVPGSGNGTLLFGEFGAAPSNSSVAGTRPGLSPPPSQPSDETTRLFLVSFMMALIFLCCLMILIIVKSRLHQQQHPAPGSSQEERDAEAGGDDGDDEVAARKRQVLEDRVQRRYETIEAWLVTKRVRHHDGLCDRIVHRYSVRAGSGDASSIPSGDGDSHENQEVECAVCMGPMRPQEWAAWSANQECTHAFHRDCIRPWLLKRMDCPCCRNELLPIDKIRGLEEKWNAIRRLTREHRQRSAITYCCDCHGLVILRPDVACSSAEIEEIKRVVVDSESAGSYETTDDPPSRGNQCDAGNVGEDRRRQSQVIGRTESDDEVEIKPDGTATSLDVESGHEC